MTITWRQMRWRQGRMTIPGTVAHSHLVKPAEVNRWMAFSGCIDQQLISLGKLDRLFLLHGRRLT
jgi:hypothetical protein